MSTEQTIIKCIRSFASTQNIQDLIHCVHLFTSSHQTISPSFYVIVSERCFVLKDHDLAMRGLQCYLTLPETPQDVYKARAYILQAMLWQRQQGKSPSSSEKELKEKKISNDKIVTGSKNQQSPTSLYYPVTPNARREPFSFLPAVRQVLGQTSCLMRALQIANSLHHLELCYRIAKVYWELVSSMFPSYGRYFAADVMSLIKSLEEHGGEDPRAVRSRLFLIRMYSRIYAEESGKKTITEKKSAGASSSSLSGVGGGSSGTGSGQDLDKEFSQRLEVLRNSGTEITKALRKAIKSASTFFPEERLDLVAAQIGCLKNTPNAISRLENDLKLDPIARVYQLMWLFQHHLIPEQKVSSIMGEVESTIESWIGLSGNAANAPVVSSSPSRVGSQRHHSAGTAAPSTPGMAAAAGVLSTKTDLQSEKTRILIEYADLRVRYLGLLADTTTSGTIELVKRILSYLETQDKKGIVYILFELLKIRISILEVEMGNLFPVDSTSSDSIRLTALEKTKQILENTLKRTDINKSYPLQNGCILMWNTMIPMIKKRQRSTCYPFLQFIAKSLQGLESQPVYLLGLVHLEMAKYFEECNLLRQGLTHSNTAFTLLDRSAEEQHEASTLLNHAKTLQYCLQIRSHLGMRYKDSFSQVLWLLDEANVAKNSSASHQLLVESLKLLHPGMEIPPPHRIDSHLSMATQNISISSPTATATATSTSATAAPITTSTLVTSFIPSQGTFRLDSKIMHSRFKRGLYLNLVIDILRISFSHHHWDIMSATCTSLLSLDWELFVEKEEKKRLADTYLYKAYSLFKLCKDGEMIEEDSLIKTILELLLKGTSTAKELGMPWLVINCTIAAWEIYMSHLFCSYPGWTAVFQRMIEAFQELNIMGSTVFVLACIAQIQSFCDLMENSNNSEFSNAVSSKSGHGGSNSNINQSSITSLIANSGMSSDNSQGSRRRHFASSNTATVAATTAMYTVGNTGGGVTSGGPTGVATTNKVATATTKVDANSSPESKFIEEYCQLGLENSLNHSLRYHLLEELSHYQSLKGSFPTINEKDHILKVFSSIIAWESVKKVNQDQLEQCCKEVLGLETIEPWMKVLLMTRLAKIAFHLQYTSTAMNAVEHSQQIIEENSPENIQYKEERDKEKNRVAWGAWQAVVVSLKGDFLVLTAMHGNVGDSKKANISDSEEKQQIIDAINCFLQSLVILLKLKNLKEEIITPLSYSLRKLWNATLLLPQSQRIEVGKKWGSLVIPVLSVLSPTTSSLSLPSVENKQFLKRKSDQNFIVNNSDYMSIANLTLYTLIDFERNGLTEKGFLLCDQLCTSLPKEYLYEVRKMRFLFRAKGNLHIGSPSKATLNATTQTQLWWKIAHDANNHIKTQEALDQCLASAHEIEDPVIKASFYFSLGSCFRVLEKPKIWEELLHKGCAVMYLYFLNMERLNWDSFFNSNAPPPAFSSSTNTLLPAMGTSMNPPIATTTTTTNITTSTHKQPLPSQGITQPSTPIYPCEISLGDICVLLKGYILLHSYSKNAIQQRDYLKLSFHLFYNMLLSLIKKPYINPSTTLIGGGEVSPQGKAANKQQSHPSKKSKEPAPPVEMVTVKVPDDFYAWLTFEWPEHCINSLKNDIVSLNSPEQCLDLFLYLANALIDDSWIPPCFPLFSFLKVWTTKCLPHLEVSRFIQSLELSTLKQLDRSDEASILWWKQDKAKIEYFPNSFDFSGISTNPLAQMEIGSTIPGYVKPCIDHFYLCVDNIKNLLQDHLFKEALQLGQSIISHLPKEGKHLNAQSRCIQAMAFAFWKEGDPNKAKEWIISSLSFSTSAISVVKSVCLLFEILFHQAQNMVNSHKTDNDQTLSLMVVQWYQHIFRKFSEILDKKQCLNILDLKNGQALLSLNTAILLQHYSSPTLYTTINQLLCTSIKLYQRLGNKWKVTEAIYQRGLLYSNQTQYVNPQQGYLLREEALSFFKSAKSHLSEYILDLESQESMLGKHTVSSLSTPTRECLQRSLHLYELEMELKIMEYDLAIWKMELKPKTIEEKIQKFIEGEEILPKHEWTAKKRAGVVRCFLDLNHLWTMDRNGSRFPFLHSMLLRLMSLSSNLLCQCLDLQDTFQEVAMDISALQMALVGDGKVPPSIQNVSEDVTPSTSRPASSKPPMVDFRTRILSLRQEQLNCELRYALHTSNFQTGEDVASQLLFRNPTSTWNETQAHLFCYLCVLQACRSHRIMLDILLNSYGNTSKEKHYIRFASFPFTKCSFLIELYDSEKLAGEYEGYKAPLGDSKYTLNEIMLRSKLSWNKLQIPKNFLEGTKVLPKNFYIIVLQHTTDKQGYLFGFLTRKKEPVKISKAKRPDLSDMIPEEFLSEFDTFVTFHQSDTRHLETMVELLKKEYLKKRNCPSSYTTKEESKLKEQLYNFLIKYLQPVITKLKFSDVFKEAQAAGTTGTLPISVKSEKKEKKKKEKKEEGKEPDENLAHFVLCLDTLLEGLPVESAISLGLNRFHSFGFSRDFSLPFFLTRVKQVVAIREAAKLSPAPFFSFNFTTSFIQFIDSGLYQCIKGESTEGNSPLFNGTVKYLDDSKESFDDYYNYLRANQGLILYSPCSLSKFLPPSRIAGYDFTSLNCAILMDQIRLNSNEAGKGVWNFSSSTTIELDMAFKNAVLLSLHGVCAVVVQNSSHSLSETKQLLGKILEPGKCIDEGLLEFKLSSALKQETSEENKEQSSDFDVDQLLSCSSSIYGIPTVSFSSVNGVSTVRGLRSLE